MAETWLRPHEAVAIIRQRQGGPIGRAQATLRAAIDSGEVRHHKGWIENRRQKPTDPQAIEIDLYNMDDLLGWFDRPVSPLPRRSKGNGGTKSKLACNAATEIWGPQGPPDLPPQEIFRKVADHVQKHYGVPISKSQVLRALGLKSE